MGEIAGTTGEASQATPRPSVEVGTGTVEREVTLSPEKFVRDLTVVKRNGVLVPFRPDRIQKAIDAAFRAHHNIPVTEPLPQEMHAAVNEVSAAVVDQLVQHARRHPALPQR